jgi:hypothetical protein
VGRGLRGRDKGSNVNNLQASLIRIVTMKPPYNEYILIKIYNKKMKCCNVPYFSLQTVFYPTPTQAVFPRTNGHLMCTLIVVNDCFS